MKQLNRSILAVVALILVCAGCGSNQPQELLETQAVTWGDIQITADQPTGEWDWSGVDTALAGQSKSIIVPIYPYALWDQANCHNDWRSMITIYGPNFQAPYPPCDAEAYQQWLTALVQRYTTSVAAWQIVALPTNQAAPIAQWVGGANSYAELAILTADAIHAVDSDAQVYVGNITDLNPDSLTFYTELLSQANLQTAVDGLTVNSELADQQAALDSLLERAGWQQPTYQVTVSPVQS